MKNILEASIIVNVGIPKIKHLLMDYL